MEGRESQVFAQLTKLAGGCEKLDVLVKQLEDRLSRVLCSPQRPLDDTGHTRVEKAPLLVPLAAEIRERSTQVATAVQVLSDLLSRIEL